MYIYHLDAWSDSETSLREISSHTVNVPTKFRVVAFGFIWYLKYTFSLFLSRIKIVLKFPLYIIVVAQFISFKSKSILL